MSSQAPTLHCLIQRVERVEKQNRSLRITGLAILLMGFTTLLMGQAAPENEAIEVEEIILRDESGHVRVLMSAVRGEPRLSFFDTNEQSRAVLTLVDEEPRLLLLDAQGKQRAGLAVLKEEPELALLDRNERRRVWLSLERGLQGLLLRDRNGNERVRMGITGGLPGIVMHTRREKVRVPPKGEQHGISLSDASGRTRALFDAAQSGAEIAFFNERGKIQSLLDGVEDNPVLTLFDAKGEPKNGLTLSGLTLRDDKGQVVFSAP